MEREVGELSSSRLHPLQKGGKALISGSELYLQQAKLELKVENSDVHWGGCAEEERVGVLDFSQCNLMNVTLTDLWSWDCQSESVI